MDAWLPRLGSSGGESLFDAWIAAENRHYPAWRSGEISFAEQRRRRLRDFLPLVGRPAGDDAALDLTFETYHDAYAAAWIAYPDAAAALTELCRFRLAVLTNGTDEQQKAKLSAVGLLNRVETVFASEALGVAKPAHESYLQVCARMTAEPARTVHIGDLYDLDVVAPREAGLQAIYLDRYNTGPWDEPLRVTSLADVPGVIARM